MSYQPFQIEAYQSGLKRNRKPFLLIENAFQELENAYVWRERVKRREGLKLLCRLRREISSDSIGNSGVSPWTINTLYSNYTTPITPEANAQIEPGTVEIIIGGAITLTDSNKDGLLSSVTAGNYGWVNYLTGEVKIVHTAGAGVATVAAWNYFPTLPVMGIDQRELETINVEETIIFDQTYSYKYSAASIQSA